MKRLLYVLLIIFTSCEKSSPLDDYIDTYETLYNDTTYGHTVDNIDYHFNMVGRCQQDNNGYYRLSLIQGENQTLHRFGAYITNIDIYGLPSQVIWSCEAYWVYNGNTVPIVNGTSFADPNVDSVFCMMAPVFDMQNDTVTIYGQAWFEEGDIILNSVDSIDFKALNYKETPKFVWRYTKPRERCYRKRKVRYRIFSAGMDRKELCY